MTVTSSCLKMIRSLVTKKRSVVYLMNFILIGIDSQSQDLENHPSIKAIIENSPEEGYNSFNFKPVDHTQVSKSIKKLNPKKATGVDQLPVKLIKAGSQALAGPISTVFNFCAKKQSAS